MCVKDIDEIEKCVNEELEFLCDGKRRIEQPYYYWFVKNKQFADEPEYKMVYLLLAFFYFKRKLFIRDADLSGFDDCNTKHIFDKAYCYLNEIDDEQIENSLFSEKTKNILKQIIYEPSTKVLIMRSWHPHYFFKEIMVREYLYHLISNPVQDDDEIYNTIRKLSSYKLCERAKAEMKMRCLDSKYINCFYDNIITGAYLIRWDRDDLAPLDLDELNEFDVYEIMERSSCCKIKLDLDYHFYYLLLWLYQHNYPELDYYEEQLEGYFEYFKSKTGTFNKMVDILKIKKAMKAALKESNDDDKSYEELVLKKILDNANEKDIKECEEELIGYGLKIHDIKKTNANWYENIIQGEYFCRRIRKLSMSDYSLAVASWSICVEDMIYEKIYKKIECTENFELKDRLGKSKSRKHPYTLGTLPYLCLNKKNNVKVFNENIILVVCSEINYNKIDTFKALIQGVDRLTEMRNKADHRTPISSEMINKCKELVFISTKIIKLLYEEFK